MPDSLRMPVRAPMPSGQIMRRMIALCLAASMTVLTAPSFGDEIRQDESQPDFSGVELRATAEFYGTDIRYAYSVFNPSSSGLPVEGFTVDLRTEPHSHQLSPNDIGPGHSDTEHRLALVNAPRLGVSAIEHPPGWLARFPGVWEAFPSQKLPQVQYGGGLPPGSEAADFALRAPGPAGIREFIIWADTWELGSRTRSVKTTGGSDEKQPIDPARIFKVGRTIGPIKEPDTLIVIEWLNGMKETARQARSIGWIRSDLLLRKLESFISALNTTDPSKLAGSVAVLSKIVMAEKAKGTLSEETEALMRLNAEYLLRRVNEGTPGKRGKGTSP